MPYFHRLPFWIFQFDGNSSTLFPSKFTQMSCQPVLQTSMDGLFILHVPPGLTQVFLLVESVPLWFLKETCSRQKKQNNKPYIQWVHSSPHPIPHPHPHPQKKGKRDTSLGLFQRFHTSDRFWYSARRYGSAVHRVFWYHFPQEHSEGYLVDCNWRFEAYSQRYWLHDATLNLETRLLFATKSKYHDMGT